MANWLNPVTDFINAMKSGASVGAEIARIKSDNAQAAGKLNQAAQAESDQNALGYAKLSSEERQGQQSAVEKLQAAMAQQSALNAYRNRSLDERSDAADNLLDYKNRSLDTRTGLRQQGLDLTAQSLSDRKAQNEIVNAARDKANDALTTRKDLSDSEKMILGAAQKKLSQGQAALLNPNIGTNSPQYGQATNAIAQANAVINSLTGGNGGATPAGGTVTPSAADSLTTPGSVSQNYGLFSPASSTSNTDATSAADALTSGTSNTLPSPAASTNPYQVGRQYGKLRYKGGDPNDENSWEAAE